MTHQNLVHFKSYDSQCVKQSLKHKNRFLIYTRSKWYFSFIFVNFWGWLKCFFYVDSGEEQYNCVWFELRGVNIVEFQLGLRPSTIPTMDLCDNDHFLQKTWLTQASKWEVAWLVARKSCEPEVTDIHFFISSRSPLENVIFLSHCRWLQRRAARRPQLVCQIVLGLQQPRCHVLHRVCVQQDVGNLRRYKISECLNL